MPRPWLVGLVLLGVVGCAPLTHQHFQYEVRERPLECECRCLSTHQLACSCDDGQPTDRPCEGVTWQ